MALAGEQSSKQASEASTMEHTICWPCCATHLDDLGTDGPGQRPQIECNGTAMSLTAAAEDWWATAHHVLMSCGLTPPLACSEWLSGRLSLCQEPPRPVLASTNAAVYAFVGNSRQGACKSSMCCAFSLFDPFHHPLFAVSLSNSSSIISIRSSASTNTNTYDSTSRV